MAEVKSTDKLLIAGALSTSAGFLLSLSNMKVSGLLVYIYLFTLFNFAAYTYIYTRSAEGEIDLPLRITAANAAMIAGVFTLTTAITYKTVFDPMNPPVTAVYVLQFGLLTLVLLPDEIASRIR